MSKRTTSSGERRRKTPRRLLLLACAVVVSTALVAAMTACGGGDGLPSDVVAEVDGQAITKSSLDHWVPIEAVISREAVPRHPPPRGEIPDPPQYTACIEYMEASAASESSASDATTGPGQFKRKCAETDKAIREHMLQILITFRWLAAECAEKGITVNDSEVQKTFAQFKRRIFGSEAVLRDFLKYTGETLADELLLIKMDLLSTKLQQRVVREGGIPGATKYFRESPRKWAAKTSCRAGYVIPLCKQYKGDKPPEPSI